MIDSKNIRRLMLETLELPTVLLEFYRQFGPDYDSGLRKYLFEATEGDIMEAIGETVTSTSDRFQRDPFELNDLLHKLFLDNRPDPNHMASYAPRRAIELAAQWMDGSFSVITMSRELAEHFSRKSIPESDTRRLNSVPNDNILIEVPEKTLPFNNQGGFVRNVMVGKIRVAEGFAHVAVVYGDEGFFLCEGPYLPRILAQPPGPELAVIYAVQRLILGVLTYQGEVEDEELPGPGRPLRVRLTEEPWGYRWPFRFIRWPFR